MGKVERDIAMKGDCNFLVLENQLLIAFHWHCICCLQHVNGGINLPPNP